ncbi:CLUMA_CG006864, isoform A, partial [Clunio marinus]
MSDYSSNYNNSALQKARQVAAKLQIAGQVNNKRSLDDFDDEPNSKRFSGGSDWSGNPSMSPAHLQQAQQAAAQVAARLGQPGGYHQQNSTIPNPEAVQKAKELISKMIPQSSVPGVPGNGPPNPRPGLGANNYDEIMIPGSKVGLIIGKGGETIKQLQERTGAKMVVVQEGPGQEMEKPLRISGDPQKVEHAKQLVYELIQDKGDSQQQNNRNNYNNRHQDRGDHGGGHGGGGNYGGGPPGGEQMEIFVPKLAVGVVIGKGGDMIKKIQAETGCRLQFLQTKNDGPGDRRCVIQGTKQQVDDGKRMIEDLIESVMRRNNEGHWNGAGGGNNSGGYQQHQQMQGGGGGGGGGGVQVVQEQFQFVVPASKCGIIIGRSGDTIKQINSQSGAHCEMDRKVSANQTVEKTFTIKGEQHQVDEAKRLIQDKINMDINLVHIGSQTVTQPANGFGGQNAQAPYQQWGGYGAGSNQGWDQNQPGHMPGQPGQIAQGQPDYSQQWIEYYRSMGMTREAEAIEAQVKAKQQSGGQVSGHAPQQPTNGAAAAAAATATQQGAATQDYSQEWANYYRSLGKIEEAEAIEKQIATAKATQAQPQAGNAYPGAQNMAAYQQFQQQYNGGYQGQQYQYPGGYPGAQQNNSDKN